MDTKLINFRIPTDLQETFDMVCDFKSQTRTQVLINLMREYISNERQPIIDQIRSLQNLNRDLSEIKRKKSVSVDLRNRKASDSERDIWFSDEDDYSSPFFKGQF